MHVIIMKDVYYCGKRGVHFIWGSLLGEVSISFGGVLFKNCFLFKAQYPDLQGD